MNITIPESVSKIEKSEFSFWSKDQTITVKGKSADTVEWDELWNDNCNAKINWE